jgi:hypothetical protein
MEIAVTRIRPTEWSSLPLNSQAFSVLKAYEGQMALVSQFLIGRTGKQSLLGKGKLNIKMLSVQVSALGTPPIKSALLP